MHATALGSRVDRDPDSRLLLSEQLRLLYTNANLGIAANITAASILCGLEWAAPRTHLIVWWSYILLVAGIRFALARKYYKTELPSKNLDWWRRAFTVGAGLTGVGWGAAFVLLYPRAGLKDQVVLIFVLGGMMLGAASLLAPLRGAFFAFLLPVGAIPTLRLLLEGDKTHVNMGILTCLFTLATLITTQRMYRTVLSSLRLQFENRDLVEELRDASEQTAALNQALEQRVCDRTLELRRSTEQLRAEIAQREQAEEELLRARKLESLGVLAGGIAHDFNNFLTVVQGNIGVARATLPDELPAHRYLDEAESACQRAKSLSSQLLTFAKGGAPVRRVVSIANLVTEAVQLARAGSNVGIDMDIAEGLWAAEVDPGQIGQVLHNILVNAREAMPEGAAIEVQAKNVIAANDAGGDDDPRVRVSVRDYGSGIAPDVLRRIFDPYFTTKPGGTGLGLATAYAIVVKHGGHITAQSAPGAGTEVTLDLPASVKTPPPAEVSVARPVHAGNGRILVMDDDPSLRVLFKAALVQLGYDVQTAAEGGEAIALYQKAKEAGAGFDAVLLDLTVAGGMGGEEAAARLKTLDPSVKMVVSSGYSDAPVMSHYADYGFNAVIEKPWTVHEMSEVLRSVLVADSAPQRG